MTRRAFGMPCSLPSDGVTTPPAGKPPGPGPSGGHEKHPGLAANAADLCFSAMNANGALIRSGVVKQLLLSAKRADAQYPSSLSL
jgi:hypothetical protein